MKFYWYEFSDGYRCCVMGMSKQELRVEEIKHGKLVRKKALQEIAYKLNEEGEIKCVKN